MSAQWLAQNPLNSQKRTLVFVAVTYKDMTTASPFSPLRSVSKLCSYYYYFIDLSFFCINIFEVFHFVFTKLSTLINKYNAFPCEKLREILENATYEQFVLNIAILKEQLQYISPFNNGSELSLFFFLQIRKEKKRKDGKIVICRLVVDMQQSHKL